VTRLRLQYIHEYADRHGRLRRYIRKPGCPRIALPGLPGSPEFMDAYQAALGMKARPIATRNREGTLAALAERLAVGLEDRARTCGSPAERKRLALLAAASLQVHSCLANTGVRSGLDHR